MSAPESMTQSNDPGHEPVARERARLEMPELLRRDVRLLGELLGQVLREYGGDKLLADVEELRHAVIAARTGAGDPADVVELVRGWSLDRAEEVARAFTVYFHLANLAEETHRVRMLRSRESGAGRPGDSLATSVAEVRRLHGDERVDSLLSGLLLHPVLTAHPTEARRRAVVGAISRAGAQLDRVDDPRGGDAEQADARRRLLEEIDILWRTAHLRASAVDPLDEVRTAMAVFDETLFLVVPTLYRGLDQVLLGDRSGLEAPQAPVFLRLGSWIGGDRDGNPNVTATSLARRWTIQAAHVAARTRASGHPHRPDAHRRRGDDAAESRTDRGDRGGPARPPEADRRADAALRPTNHIGSSCSTPPPGSRPGGSASAAGYRRPDELIADLRMVQESLVARRRASAGVR